MIRPCLSSDSTRIAEIYNYYVRETVVTFEERPVSSGDMAERIDHVTRLLPWLVWQEGSDVLGYAYAARWHERPAYRYSCETTIYVDPSSMRRGIGTSLYAALMAALRRRNIHCAVGAVALPNPASVALHEKVGFAKIGHLEQVGWKLGRWVDVGYWQLVLG